MRIRSQPCLVLAALALAACSEAGLSSDPRGVDSAATATGSSGGATAGSTASSSAASSTGSIAGSTSGSSTASSASSTASSGSGGSGSSGTGTASSSSSSSSGSSGSTGVVTVAEILVVGQVATSGAASDIAFGPDGTLYAADPYPQDNSLLTFDGSGQAVIWSGGSAVGMDQNGPRTSARFDGPYALTFVGDTLYVAESSGHVIRQIDGSGQVTTFCGTGVNGFADGNCSTAQFDTPTGIVADAQGDLFVADSYNHRIRKIDTSGHVTTWAGQTQSGLQNGTGIQARLNYPIAVAIDDQGNLFVADSGNMAIRKIDPSRNVTTFALMPVGSPVPHGRPYGVAVDAQGNVYAADLDNGGIDRFAANGTLTAQVTDSNLQSAAGMAFDSQGRLFATGMGNGAVVQVDIP